MNFAEKLRDLREAKGLSQKELGDLSGCSQRAISSWEQGLREPLFSAVRKICDALGVDCKAFEGCEIAEMAALRPRGRPPKVDAEPAPEVTKPAVAKGKAGRKPKKSP